MTQVTYLAHYGIGGMKWGIRRYQYDDGTLTPAGIKRYQKLDQKWIDKKSNDVYEKAFKESKTEIREYLKHLEETSLNVGKRTLINNYNNKLAQIMRTKTSEIRSPSGKVVEWIAKRGEIGVHMALADAGYDVSKLKNGVWADGRVAYKKNTVDMQSANGGR
jgi:hypothetical protein